MTSTLCLTLMIAPTLFAAFPAGASADPRWADPLRLNSAGATNGDDARIAVFANGNAVAVWTHPTGVDWDFFARTYSPATGWGPEAAVDNVALGNVISWSVQLASNSVGQAVATWAQYNGTVYAVFAATFDATWGSGAWSTPTQVQQSGQWNAGFTNNPAASINDNGDAAVAWMWQPASGFNVSAARLNRSGAWSPEERVGNVTNGTAYDLGVVIDLNRYVHVVWGENNATDEWLWTSRYTPGGTWSAKSMLFQFRDNGPSVVWTDYVQLGADRAGNALCVFQVYDGSNGWLYTWGVTFSPASGWSSAGPLNWSGTSGRSPTLAVRPDGLMYVVHYSAGQLELLTWSASAGFTKNPGAPPGVAIDRYGVAVNAAGLLTVVWNEYGPTSYHIKARQFAPWLGGWGPVYTVDPAATVDDDPSPLVGIDASGTALAVWRQNAAGNNIPYASRLALPEPSPLPLVLLDFTDDSSTGVSPAVINGFTTPRATVEIGSLSTTADAFGRFAIPVPLQEGWNTLTIKATGTGGSTASTTIEVAYTDPGPARAKEASEASSGFEGWAPTDPLEGSARRYYDGAIRSKTNERGDTVVLWQSYDYPAFVMRTYANVFLIGSGWQAPHLLSIPNGALQEFALVISPQGDATIVLWESFPTSLDVYVTRFEVGSGWSGYTRLNQLGAYTYWPRVAVGTTGEVFVTFLAWNSTQNNYDPHWARFVPGLGWSSAQLMVHTCYYVYTSALVILGANDARYVGGCFNGPMIALRYTLATGWVSQPNITNASGPNAYMDMVINQDGEATLAVRLFKPNSTTDYQLYAARSNFSGAFGSLVAIENQSSSYIQGPPSIGVDINRRVWVVWQQAVNGTDRALANSFVSGSGWTGEAVIDLNNTPKNNVQAAVSLDGSVHVVWYTAVAGYTRVQWQRWTYGGGWQPPEVAPESIYYSTLPAVSVSANGVPFVLYSGINANFTSYMLYANRWAPRTPPLLTLIAPSNFSTVNASLLAVTGTTEAGANVTVNGYAAAVNGSLGFSVAIPLRNGTNTITVIATDRYGQTTTVIRNVTFVDPVLVSLANLTAADAAILQAMADQNASLIAELAAQNASLLTAIADLNASLLAEMAAQDGALAQLIADTNMSLLADLAAVNSDLLQTIGDLNQTLLAQMAAGDGALAASLASTNATLFAALASQNASLLSALASQNASLLASLAATNATLAAKIAATNASLLASLAAQNASLRDALADQNLELLAALAAQNSSLLATIGSTNATLLARLAATNATLYAQLAAGDGALWAALNASSAQQASDLHGTQTGLDSTNSTLEDTQADLSETQQRLASANLMATLGTVIGVVGLAAAVIAFMLARKRPPIVGEPAALPSSVEPPKPVEAEEVSADAVAAPKAASHGTSMASEGEVGGTGENDG